MKRPLGLDLEEVRKQLMEIHNTALEEHDPIFMLVTLHNLFGEEYNRLLALHHTALKNTMKGLLKEYSKEMRRISNELMNDTVRSSIENTVTEIALHQTAMNSFLVEMRKHSFINLACTLICFLALIGVLVFGGGQ